MIIAGLIIWYLVGVVLGGFIIHKDFGEITVKDAVFLLSLGGIGGLFTPLIFLLHSVGDKKLF